MNLHIESIKREERELRQKLSRTVLPSGYRYADITSQTQFSSLGVHMPIIVNDKDKTIRVISINGFLTINELPFGLRARHRNDVGIGEKISSYEDVLKLEK